MSILKIVKYGESVLREPTKEVSKVSKKIKILVEDMLDTMYRNNGVGLAAPQVGESLRIFVIDVSLDDEPLNPMVFINPKIIKKSGAVCSNEGCLSFPNAYVDVRRYANVMVKALDIKGRPFVLKASNGELLARAIQHEFDHLNGILFVDHCRNVFDAISVLEKNNLPEIDRSKLIDEPELEEEIQKQQEQQKQAEENDDKQN